MRDLRQRFRTVLRYFLAPAVLALSLGASQPASGTTLMRMSLAQISQAAQAIVRARCIGNSTRWDAGEIWTFTSFDIEETWSGSAPAQISVRLLGGRVGNLTSTVSGVPRFSPGEEVVLFLEHYAARRLFHRELGAGHLPHSPRRSHGRRSRRAGHRRLRRLRSGHAPLRDYWDSQSSDCDVSVARGRRSTQRSRGDSRETRVRNRHGHASRFQHAFHALSGRLPDGFDGAAIRRMPRARSVESLRVFAARSPVEHVTAAHAANDSHGRHRRNERATHRNRAGNFGFFRRMVRRHRHDD